MGDSVLDNFFWLETPSRPLRVQLQETLGKSRDAKVRQLQVVNLAVDQMTTFDFEERSASANPWDVYAQAREKVDFEAEEDKKYMVDQDGIIRSVKNLKSLNNVRWVILSLGGNDVYLNSGVKTRLINSLVPGSEGVRKEVAKEFGARLKKVAEQVQKAAPDATLVLVVPYQPHEEFSLLAGAPINDEGARIYGDFLGDGARGLERQLLPDLVTPMVTEILTLAQDLDCPVIDLSQTFDSSMEEHYGTGEIGRVNSLGTPWSGAEPSDVSSNFIAQLIANAIAQGKKTVLYSGNPRQEERGWSLRVKEEVNDWILAEDYRFGGKTRSRLSSKPGKPMFQLDAFQSFALGAGLVIAINSALLLQGNNPLFFDRSEFEQQLKSQGLKVPASTTSTASK
ncbi:hypothetical protein AK812_SmicGene11855 [Symbiodinium microadriaticum]|uniref:SGNH hydrolase-type esterase domain-containing protein n=1 Tax=Symbiodinium microadriaticum TaxID=2951 RepID=A0A1Q9EC56_SYMMI|nr:hypothetical protein AK812_SmicGene11855 [Symbiodinium microadriaticum]